MIDGVALLKETYYNGRTFREMYDLLEKNGFTIEEAKRAVIEYGKEHFAPNYDEERQCLYEINRHPKKSDTKS